VVRRIAVAVLALCVAAAGCVAAPLTILYTNDLHLRFGRLDSIERLIAAERSGDVPVLLFDAGDAWQDFRTPLAAVWGADEMVAWMGRVGYDAMALGNHDMYWGAARLEELTRAGGFPILCANLRPVVGVVPFTPSMRLEAGAIPVLAIGLITEELLPYSAFPNLRTIGQAAAVREEIDRTAEPGDVIVVVAHLPVVDAIRVAQRVPEIDVFVTGHSHETTPDPVCVGETLIVQAGAFGRMLGRLTIDVDRATGAHTLLGHDLLSTEKAPTDVGRGLRRLILIALAVAAAALVVLL
jgi:5'-nucleotidase